MVKVDISHYVGIMNGLVKCTLSEKTSYADPGKAREISTNTVVINSADFTAPQHKTVKITQPITKKIIVITQIV